MSPQEKNSTPRGSATSAPSLPVSYGTEIRKPRLLQTRSVQELLFATRDGEWRHLVENVRSLPDDSSSQRMAKARLPYVTWSGEFSRRDTRHLLQHSGLLAFDLDGIPEAQARRILHIAVDDRHCLAAFFSARGNGMRLILRASPVNTPEEHSALFTQASIHVRTRYGADPDPSGSDVARASFVSWDRGLWLNAQAIPLPVDLPLSPAANPITTMSNHCGNSSTPWWIWCGREILPFEKKQDGSGTLRTHFVLLRLGQRIALRAVREGMPLFDEIAEQAAAAWYEECERRGRKVRGRLAEYRDELIQIFRGAPKCKWFAPAADKWTRWTREPDCPHEPRARLLYVISRHCSAEGDPKFFLGWRDAGAIAGLSHVRAGELLREFVAKGILERVKTRRAARHAVTYRLISGGVQ